MSADLEAVVESLADALGLALVEGSRANVAGHLGVLLAMAATFEAVPLPPDAAQPSVFEP